MNKSKKQRSDISIFATQSSKAFRSYPLTETKHHHGNGFVKINDMKVDDIESELFSSNFNLKPSPPPMRKQNWKHQIKHVLKNDIAHKLDQVAEVFDVSAHDIKKQYGHLDVVLARNAFMYVASKFGFSHQEIADFLKCVRSNVSRQIAVCEDDMQTIPEYSDRVGKLFYRN